MNKEFGAGFVSLQYLVEGLPDDVYRSWKAYFAGLAHPPNQQLRARREAERRAAEKAEKDHQDAMAQAKRALGL